MAEPWIESPEECTWVVFDGGGTEFRVGACRTSDGEREIVVWQKTGLSPWHCALQFPARFVQSLVAAAVESLTDGR